jgi:hypothetical protein
MSASILTSPTGRYTTTCKLCRRRVAESPALDIPIVGQPGKKVQELLTVLVKHLMKHHAEQFAEGVSIQAEFTPFLILAAFEHEDPSIAPRLENIRAAIFERVRKNSFRDADLEHIVAGFGLDPTDQDRVNEAMKAVRDACCEFGQFAPKIPQESKIIPV